MVDPTHSFHIADYAVFAVTIVISIAIGIYYAMAGGRQKTTSEYLVGGRTMKFLPVAISLMVSFESSIMMLGLPAEVYVYGIQWWMACAGFLISQLLSILIVVPLLHPLKLTSAYEYLQYRYNSTPIRLLGSFLGMLTYTWYMGIVLFGPAIALEAVTGFSQWSSIFVIAFVSIIYTSIGGLKAVIWTDVFQAFVMYAGMFAILIKGTLDVGGATKVWELAREGGRLNFFNFDPDPTTRHTFWNLFFGSLIRGFGLAFNQSTVQRISATKSQREANWVLLITAPCFFLSMTMACYEGIVAFAYYETVGCDPLGSKKITNPNQVIPFTVMDIFKTLPGMPGLFLASLFSASLSTLSSGLSSLSALLWADFIKPRIGEVSEVKATIIAKISVVVFGLLGCGVALLVSVIGGPLTQISGSLLAAFAGPLTGLFLMGCFCPWTNSTGAFWGGVVSLVFSSWLSLGTAFSKSKKRQPWLPFASLDMCLANQNASFMDTTPAAMEGYTFTDALWNSTHYDYDSVYGFDYDARDHYSSVAATFLESTTQTLPEIEPQGIERMYTLSYQWLSPVGIIVTVLLGSIISLLTGGCKQDDLDPRYLISFCDHMCCYMPECIRKHFRCYDDYSTVKTDPEPLHDFFMDNEVIIPPPTQDKVTTVLTQSAPVVNGNNTTVTIVMEIDTGFSLPGSDVKRDDTLPDDGDQNGGSYVSFIQATDEDGDVVGKDDVGKQKEEKEVKEEEKVKDEKNVKEEEEDEEEEERNQPEAPLLLEEKTESVAKD